MLYIFALGGVFLSLIFHFAGVQNEQWYSLAIAVLLGIGLYSSTYGISITEARSHLKLIVAAVTIGVAVKAIIIGLVMALVLQSPFGFILGIVVAQIDPLSTAALQKGKRLSAKAKAIIGAWASFDDPVTVILALYLPITIAAITGTQWQAIEGTVHSAGLQGYFVEIGRNLLFAAGIFLLWSFIKRYAKVRSILLVLLAAVGIYIIVSATLVVAILYFMMLGIALIGLFMRPPIQQLIDQAVQWALCMAAVLLGILLVQGINVPAGIALGAATFGAQIIVGYLLTRKLATQDRLHIAFAQQNGITAIILALLFEPYYPGTVAIVGPGILVTNVLHMVANKVLDAHSTSSLVSFTPRQMAYKIKAHISRV